MLWKTLRSPRLPAVALLGAGALVAGLLVLPGGAAAEDSKAKQAAEGRLEAPVLTTPLGITRHAPTLSAGLVESARQALAERAQPAAAARAAAPPSISPPELGVSPNTLGCRRRDPDGNIRVNQDCTFRRQAEELIKANPTDPNNLIAGQNDSRVGYNHCGFDYSVDGGNTWGDGIPPFFQRQNAPPAPHTIRGGPGTDHTYDAASDPALAFDSQGRAFYSCVLFDINSAASAVLVTQSPAGAGGSFYDNVPAAGPTFVVAEDNSPLVAHDKEFITADIYPASPNRDNVYVTWTVFRYGCGPSGTGYCSAPIFGAMSTDHAVTWSPPEEISGQSQTLCSFGNFFDPTQPEHACNVDQGSDPTVLPNGDIAVVFTNGNTDADNPNSQQLAVTCHPSGSSTDGTARLNCGAPAKVGDDVVINEPQCNFGRGLEECIPGSYVRTNDFPRIAVDKTTGDLFATWQDYRTGQFEIQLSGSMNGGRSWLIPASPVNPDRGMDHSQPAIDVSDSHQVAVSYYRTGRVPNEKVTPPEGFAPCPAPPSGSCQPGVQQQSSDYSLSGGWAFDTPYTAHTVSPSFPPPDGNQAGFLGDYSGLTVVGSVAHPIWADTRNAVPVTDPPQGLTHDEDVFTDAVAIPSSPAGRPERRGQPVQPGRPAQPGPAGPEGRPGG